MKVKNIISNSWFKGALFLLSGLWLGWLLFHKSGEAVIQNTGEQVHEHSKEEQYIWSCSMHPQIRRDEPGNCPICGMDLIPLQNNQVSIDEDAISMSEAAIRLAEVQTALVSYGKISRDVLLYGKIQFDERHLQSQAAHVPGRIEKLLVNITGETVKSGQQIATIYSPDLVTTQKELLEALSMKDKYPTLIEAVREKLRNWKLSDAQIREIESSGSISSTYNIYSNTTGVVTELKVNQGDYVQTGSVLFTVADLSQVWGVFDAYESDLPWISKNQEVEFTTQAVPGKVFKGKVSFIDPLIDPVTRTARVRITLENPDLQLKPEMFINGTIRSTLNNGGKELTIPQSAVLWTGIRSLVYVKVPGTEHPTFKMREIKLGPAMKNAYVIQEGLSEGEEIVVNGTFSVDATAQLAGKKTMMNPGESKVSAGHDHGAIELNVGKRPNDSDENSSMNMYSKTYETDPKFKAQLTAVYENYINMKNAFVLSDVAKVSEEAKKVKETLKSVDMMLLSGEAHIAWKNQQVLINNKIETIVSENNIENQRLAFSDLNLAFYKSVKIFGLLNETVYYQYCPMANNNKGAYWLSETEEIKNPYFGDMMMSCGETKEIILSSQSK